MARNSDGIGTYNLNGSAPLLCEYEVVGYSGTGTFAHSGGTSQTGELDLGYDAGGIGTYNLNGNGQLWASSENVGCSGTGTFNQSAGTNQVTWGLTLGCNPGMPAPTTLTAACSSSRH